MLFYIKVLVTPGFAFFFVFQLPCQPVCGACFWERVTCAVWWLVFSGDWRRGRCAYIYISTSAPRPVFWVSRYPFPLLLLPEGGPLPGSKSGLLSNTQKWIVRGDTRANKARDFIGKGRQGREQGDKGTQENCSAMWLAVSGFMLTGLAFWVVSGQSSCLCPYLVWLRVLPGGTCSSQPRWIPAQRILGGW